MRRLWYALAAATALCMCCAATAVHAADSASTDSALARAQELSSAGSIAEAVQVLRDAYAATPSARVAERFALLVSSVAELATAEALGEAVTMLEGTLGEEYAPAITLLALCYNRAAGVASNQTRAFELFEHAAAIGHADAAFFVGNMLYDGSSGRVDLPASARYFALAAAGNHTASAGVAAMLYANGVAGAENMTLAEPLAWQAFKSGDTSAGNLLVEIYTRGIGVEADLQKAHDVSVALSDMGVDAATLRVAGNLMTGAHNGGAVDVDGAVMYLDRLAYRDVPQALEAAVSLGILEFNRGNNARAVRPLRRALQINATDVTSLVFLGRSLLTLSMGEAIEGVTLLEQAVRLGSADAAEHLAAAYEDGIGVLQDYVRAHTWSNIAALLGSANGRTARARLTRQLDAARLVAAQERAAEWVQRHLSPAPAGA